MKKSSSSLRTLILIAATALSACSGLEPGRLDLDDLSSLKPSRTAYHTVISRCGPPLREETSGGEIRATYAVEQEATFLSNIDGKGFVRGVGCFVNTYPVGSQDVTLVFDANSHEAGLTPDHERHYRGAAAQGPRS